MTTLSQRVRGIIGDSFGASIVEQNLEKAIQEIRESASAPQTTFYDPLSMFMGNEWMTKLNAAGGLDYQTLRSMARNPIVGAVVQTRVNQVAAYCVPQADAYEVGFRIVSDDTAAQKETETIKALTQWVYTGGIPGYGEQNLETFARKFIRDSLVLDQACGEVVMRRNKLPAYFVAIDAATIRKLKKSLDYATPSGTREPEYAQVIQDQIVTRYTADQMIFGVRNPQTDINYVGYGASELEILVRVVTTIINTERYNSGQLAQGGTQKGLLVVKGQADKGQMESFKRDFREAVRNAASYWRPPVLQIGEGGEIEWVTLDRSNRDMEYAQLFDFLVKQTCAVYQMEPNEINWTIGQSGTTTNFEGSSSASNKITEAQKRGLKPLLTFLANHINASLIQKIDPRFRLEFVGMNVDKKTDIELRVKEVTNYRTLNEVRADMMLPEIKGGDIVLNDNYLKALGIGEAQPNPNAGKPGEKPKKSSDKGAKDDLEFNTAEEL